MPHSIEKRQEIERKIARRTVRDLLKAGYTLALDNGGEELEVERTASSEKILSAMFATDDEHVFAFDSNGNKAGWVWFVYGNDGWDVIADYTTNLDAVLDPIIDWVDKFIPS